MATVDKATMLALSVANERQAVSLNRKQRKEILGILTLLPTFLDVMLIVLREQYNAILSEVLDCNFLRSYEEQ